ncbi:MAG: class II aldolase/adducin family protein [Deltaproteobacteria bacterium]|nr:MAG: class II aldolase/adducin family protein [Deltaproteobacteria bacterium]
MHPLARAQVASAARRIHAAGWAANHDGNISVRIGRDRFLITPTATSKAEITESSLIVIDGSGKVVEGTRKPPGETELHLAAYRARPDVEAVLHAHPPYATAFGAARVPLEPVCLPEAVVSLGYIPLAPFAMPKTPLATEAVSRCAVEADAMLLPGNGALTLAPDVALAFLRMELVEHLAKILHHARALGGAQPLPPDEMATLLEQNKKTFPRGKR